jgi:hypothetical protein
MSTGAATGHTTGNTGVRQMGKSGVQGDVGKGVRDTHSTGQDVKQQRSGMGMSTEGGKNNLAALQERRQIGGSAASCEARPW